MREGVQSASAGDLPQAHTTVLGASGRQPIIGADDDRPDPIPVLQGGPERTARVSFPDPCRPISAPRQDQCAVRRVGDRLAGVVMPQNLADRYHLWREPLLAAAFRL